MDAQFQYVKSSWIHLSADKNIICKTLFENKNFVLTRQQQYV